jgi:diaminopimelate epimerase
MISTSGIAEPVPVHIDTEAHTAEIVISGPVSPQTDVLWEGRHFPVYEFEGITHIIAADVPANEQLVRSLIRRYTKICGALGVMFYNSQNNFMRPAVWVRETDTLVFESSCGSGSAAVGVWAARDESDIELDIDLAQPGGTITVKVVKQAGNVTRLCIGGTVELTPLTMQKAVPPY